MPPGLTCLCTAATTRLCSFACIRRQTRPQSWQGTACTTPRIAKDSCLPSGRMLKVQDARPSDSRTSRLLLRFLSCLLVLWSLLLLLLLLLGVRSGGKQLLHFFILHRASRGHLLLQGSKRQPRDFLRAPREQQQCELKLSHHFALLFSQDRVLLEQLVALGLRNADPCHLLIFDGTERERQRREAAVHLGDKLSSLLRLEVVARLHGPFVHSVPQLRLLSLAFPCRHDDVDAVDLIHFKLKLLDPLLLGLTAKNAPVAVDDMLLQLVRQHPLHGCALELRPQLAEGSSHRAVCVAYLDEAEGGLCCVPCSHDHVRPPILDLFATHHQGVGCCRDKTINVARQVDFCHVSCLKSS
mmetsp:Transcript_36138/g.111204  ORF Transcript_36138/g.111204 Transcript_36138/m.111204 type:complete len:355 (+) Transcript_36138:121-1185(+)